MSDTDPLKVLQPAASKVRDPVTGRSVWLAGMVRNARIEGQELTFDLVFTSEHTRADRRSMEAAVVENIKGVGWEGQILPSAKLEAPSQAPQNPPNGAVPGASGGMTPHGGPIVKKVLPGVKRIICVAPERGESKKTVSVNLAIALRRIGHSVGLMTRDIYGPSIPTMLRTEGRPHADQSKKIIPLMAHGVKCLSIGMMMPSDQAVIWRGPMVQGALRNFIQDTQWGDLDYLIVDMPPGTGDAQLTLIQSVDLAGAIVVTTPQKVALDDAIRGIAMFQKLDVPLLGLVENMAWYALPDGSRDYVFGQGGGLAVSVEYGTELLTQIPLRTMLRASADDGQPAALGDSEVGEIFLALARSVAEKCPVDGA